MREFPDGSKIDGSASGSVSFNGPSAVDVYRLTTLVHMLRLEAKTGMKINRYMTALQAAEREWYAANPGENETKRHPFGVGAKGREKAGEWVQKRLDALLATST